jgi:hypothetical protein
MEEPKLSQEQAPQLSIVEQKRQIAEKAVEERVKTLMEADKTLSSVDAFSKVYEEVKGNDYYSEQMLAKFLKLFETKEEAEKLTKEIGVKYPAVSKIFNNKAEASNGDKYLVAA